MTTFEQKRIIQLCGFMGFVEEDKTFFDIYADKERKQIVASLEGIICKLKLKPKDFEKVHNKVLKGDLRLEVVSDEDINFLIKRYKKTKVGLDMGDLFTIIEHACLVCKNCKRLRSACALRKALIKAKAPVANDGIGKCQFNCEEE